MRKGIILSGGQGTRLFPSTMVVSKQLLPIYDKPMIFYPLTTLMLSGITDILVIVTPKDLGAYKTLLGTGDQWGISIKFAVQESPNGIAESLILGRDFLDNSPVTLILGDNLFFGHGFSSKLLEASQTKNATIFIQQVNDPQRYGVVEFDDTSKIRKIIEKPVTPPSKFAVTGLYFLDETASERAKALKPSKRNELEITDLLNSYLIDSKINYQILGRGNAWFDAGTHASLNNASNFVRTLYERQGVQVAAPDEIALHCQWIDMIQFIKNIDQYKASEYSRYLKSLIE